MIEKITRFSPSPDIGLSTKEVELRNKENLVNITPNNITKSYTLIFKENIFTFFNLLNLIICVALIAVGAYKNVFFIFIIIANVLIAIIQEIKAKKTIEALSLINVPHAIAIRDSKEVQIDYQHLVLDDIIKLSIGDQVPSDAIIIRGSVEVNEALLTGESESVKKMSKDFLLSGSAIISGTAYAQIEHVGQDNYAAKLVKEAKKHRRLKSQLLDSMAILTKLTAALIVPIGIALFLQAYYGRSNGIEDSVVFTSAALLGMLPKGLVLLISLSLAVGVIKLVKKKILVRELHSIEALARVDVLCIDKTGTITEGEMKVSSIFSVKETLMPVSLETAFGYLVSTIKEDNSTLKAIRKHFQAVTAPQLVYQIPFSSERKFSAISLARFGTLVLGAPDRLNVPLPIAAKQAMEEGKRLLCLCYSKEILNSDNLMDLQLAAVVAISDEIRQGAAKTLEFFSQQGVEVKIISGDHPVTISTVARQAGLKNYLSYIDLSNKTDEQVKELADKYTIFGRVSPYQKKLLVEALKGEGKQVAMIGDGVNDLLALREADCGVAIASGSDAAKQISQLVLMDSDFTSLPIAVMEGRRVINNITRVASIFFVKTFYSVLLAITCIILTKSYPFFPLQITLIDAAIEAYPAFFIAFEPDHRPVKGRFLLTSVRNALPFSVLILIVILILHFVCPTLNMTSQEELTAIYLVTGFISIMALFKALLPLNKLRIALILSSSIGFYLAAFLFRELLDLVALPSSTWPLLIGMSLGSIPAAYLLICFFNKIFKRFVSK